MEINLRGFKPAVSSLTVGELSKDRQIEVINKCESEPCRIAKRALTAARNKIYRQCTLIQAKESARTTAAMIASGLLTAAIALTVAAAASAATWWGIPAAVFMLIAAAVLYAAAAAAAVAAAVLQSDLGKLRRQLDELQTGWEDLIDVVEKSCTEYCLPDLDVPRCTDRMA